MKKLLTILLIMTVSASFLVGCGDTDKGISDDKDLQGELNKEGNLGKEEDIFSPNKTEKEDPNELQEGEMTTITDENGNIAIYYNWNGYIVRFDEQDDENIMQLYYKICYSDNYEVVIVGSYAAMKVPEWEECDDKTKELYAHVRTLGYSGNQGFIQTLNIGNEQDFIVGVEISK